MKPRRIAFYGNFGTQNLGNECTLQAIIHNIQNRSPKAEFKCICTIPEDTARRHNISAFRSYAEYPEWLIAKIRPGHDAPVTRLLRILLFRIPIEILHWANGLRVVKGSHMLIVPGTGVVSDHMTGPFSWPYTIFKWSMIAKLCRAKLLFVSIGVGPINHPLSRWFIKTALRLADDRSYRDTASREYMGGIGFHANEDRVCPDLAFGLPRSMFPERPPGTGQRPVIGVGLKDYYGPRGMGVQPDASAYHDYLNTMAAFVTWLCEHRYTVRVLIGDVRYDSSVGAEFMGLLEKRGLKQEGRQVVSEPALTVDQLVSQIAETDVVISPRLHSLVLALMLNKPVIALSDHQKLDALMAGLGFADYCVPLRSLNLETLIEKLVKLERNAEKLKPCIKLKVEKHRAALEQEYSAIFPAEQA